MKLRNFVIAFVALWLVSAISVPWLAGSLEAANDFGGSFGAVSSLFSGLALALAIYSMILQQRQSAQFENATLKALELHADMLELIKANLLDQANNAQVSALGALIRYEEDRAEKLRDWGLRQGDEHKYGLGIKSATRKSVRYREQLRRHAELDEES